MTYSTWMDKSLHSNIYFTLNMTMCWAKFSSSKAKDASSDSVLKKKHKSVFAVVLQKQITETSEDLLDSGNAIIQGADCRKFSLVDGLVFV